MFESLHALWYRIRSRFRRDALDAELADELKLHSDLLEEDARRAGMSPEDARRTAAQRLGNNARIRERTRERWSFGFVEPVLQDAVLLDVRYAVRFLRRSPAFTTVAVLSLALGIGANAAVFTVADRLFFSNPPHVANVKMLSMLNVQRNPGTGKARPFYPITKFAEAFALRQYATSFAAVTIYTPPERRRLGDGLDAPRFKVSMVTSDFFDVLGVKPVKGRFLSARDDSASLGTYTAVISHAFWQRQYGGADSAIGARLITSDLNFIVVGVAPRDFTGVEMDAADAWVPLEVAAPTWIEPEWKSWDGSVPKVIVRLRDSVTAQAAATEATAILRRLPEASRRGKVEETVALGSVIQARGPSEQQNEVQVSMRLVLASAMVLLAACANLANLLLVRALTRRREIALRLAIGVTRGRLASQMLIESLLIALAGSAAALIVARWGGAALRTLVFPQIQWASGTVDARVFGFAVLCGTAVAVLATIAPAIRMTRADVSVALRSAAPQLTASTGRLRQTLLALQVALSVVLIVGATSFGRSLANAYSFDFGFDVDRIITTRMWTNADSMPSAEKRVMLAEAARRVRTIPGVELATVSEQVPLRGSKITTVRIPERDLPPRSFTLLLDVTPEMQHVAGFRLTRGRWITDADVAPGMPTPVLVSEVAVNKIWPGIDPLGRCVRLVADTSPCGIVVGVIRDLRQRSIHDPDMTAMLFGTREPDVAGAYDGYVVIRAKRGVDLAKLVAPIRSELRQVRPDVTRLEVELLESALDFDYRPLRLGTAAFGSFAILATILAAVGLYGILAFSVAQRSAEFGIRSALGARATQLVRNVVGEGVGIVTAGLVVGIALSWYVSKTINELLFESTARDFPPYAYAVMALGCVALVASAFPAWRATRVDPATALRAE